MKLPWNWEKRAKRLENKKKRNKDREREKARGRWAEIF